MRIKFALDLLCVFLLGALLWRIADHNAQAGTLNQHRLSRLQLISEQLHREIRGIPANVEAAMEGLRADLCWRHSDLEVCNEP